jgi:ubiquinone/menaquinone biosynthesis C-methylase UbiE
MKDNFSKQADEYARFRPQYPKDMIAYIVDFVRDKNCALDVATGNGQVANELAAFFHTIYATDISENQLKNAKPASNIIYQKQSAEHTEFKDEQFDLIAVAQAIHWFDFDAFYKEVYRILKADGIFAVLGYGVFSTNGNSDAILRRYYHEIVGPYWDAERKYIDAHYTTIPFPFEEIKVKQFSNNFEWSFGQLVGYLETWSATQHYKKENNANPIQLIYDELKRSWESGDKQVTFPLLLRIGKLK